MSFDNLMLRLDRLVTGIIREWDVVSTALAVVILTILISEVVYGRDPDSHPFLLARQSQASPVRNEGESVVLRSHSAPHGMELSSGLNVKDAGASRWARGRDGDLRDVWRKAVLGATDKEDKPTGEKGKLLTILGVDKVIEHDMTELSQQIQIIGEHIKSNQGSRVAIYLPNSVEILLAIFASAFYGFTPILLPYDQPTDKLVAWLEESKADTVIAAAGSFAFESVSKEYPGLKQLIWVVDEGSKHLDWTEIPAGTGSAVKVSTWQSLVEDHKSSESVELPSGNPKEQPPPVVTLWQGESGDKFWEYSQSNIAAAISGQLYSIPGAQRFTPSDLLLPVESLASMYTLVLTFAALFSNSSVAFNSVAGSGADLVLATHGIAPTIIIASANTMLKIQEKSRGKLTSLFYQGVHWLQTRTLTQNGVMPVASTLSKFNDALRPAIGTAPGKLRLIYVPEQAHVDVPPLNSTQLSDLRIFTGARIIYALTAAPVAGAVAQTNLYDYRISQTAKDRCSHFGAPVTSVEVFLRDTKDRKTTDDESVGEIIARGPAVIGGEAALGVIGRFNEDLTLAYN